VPFAKNFANSAVKKGNHIGTRSKHREKEKKISIKKFAKIAIFFYGVAQGERVTSPSHGSPWDVLPLPTASAPFFLAKSELRVWYQPTNSTFN